MGVTGVHDFLTKKAASRPATWGKMSSDKGQLKIKGGVSLSNFHRRPANGENYSRKFLQKRSVGGIYSEKFLQKRSVGGIYSEKRLQKRSVGGNYSEKHLQKGLVGGIYSRKHLQKRSVGRNYSEKRLQKGSGGGNVAIGHSFSCLDVGKRSKRASRRQGCWPNWTGDGPYGGRIIRCVCGGGRGRRAWLRCRGGR